MGSKLDLYKAFLDKEGYAPTVDGSLLFFKKEGRGYALLANEDDATFYQLVFPNFWNIENDKERAKAYAAANHATGTTKVAKVFVREDGKNVWGAIEMFFESPDQFKPVFDRGMLALSAAVANFVQKMA
jgi:hypothetical protein